MNYLPLKKKKLQQLSWPPSTLFPPPVISAHPPPASLGSLSVGRSSPWTHAYSTSSGCFSKRLVEGHRAIFCLPPTFSGLCAWASPSDQDLLRVCSHWLKSLWLQGESQNNGVGGRMGSVIRQNNFKPWLHCLAVTLSKWFRPLYDCFLIWQMEILIP